MKKVIVFDLWKTLAGEHRTIEQYFPILLDYLNGRLTEDEVVKLAEKFVMTKPVDLKDGIESICKSLGINDSEIIKKVFEKWKYSCDRCYLFSDTIKVLEALRKEYKLALITNTSKYGWEQVEEKFKLGKYFDLLVLSFEQQKVKPNKKLFEYVEKKLPAKRYMMIGDSQKSDIDPTKKIGWDSLLLKRGSLKRDDNTLIKKINKIYQ